MRVRRACKIVVAAAMAVLVLAAPASAADYPGHVPGKVCLGMSAATDWNAKLAALGGDICVHRSFLQWDEWDKIEGDIVAARAADQMPWVSFKPPTQDAAGWRSIASGAQDAKLRELATMLKANDADPILLTFHHEPSNDGAEADGDDWAAAHVHIHDVLQAEGALVNTAFVPILGEWLFAANNSTQNPVNWLTPAVMTRMPFLGIDLYENNAGTGFATRLPAIIEHMSDRGFDKMVGIGEWGCTDALFPTWTISQCMNENLNWLRANTDKIGVASYFNSGLNSKPGVYWPLDESSQKTTIYRNALDDVEFLNVGPTGSSTPPPPPVGDLSVDITSPSNGATISGAFMVAANVTGAAAGVHLRIDGEWLAKDTTAPYSFPIAAGQLSDGAHSIEVRANAEGGSESSADTVNVTIGSAPTLTITSPADGATLSGAFTVAASMSGGVALSGVHLRIDGVWQSKDETAPYSFPIAAGSLSAGAHTIELRANDSSGTTISTDSVAVTVQAAAPAWTNFRSTAVASWMVPFDNWTSTTPNETARVDEVRRVGSTTWLGGNFTTVRSQTGSNATRTYVAAVDSTTGALRTGFNATVNGRVTALDVTPDGSTVFIGGEFTQVNGAARDGLAALDAATGALRTSLPNQNVSGTIYSIDATNTQVYVGGLFGTIDGAARDNIARLDLVSGTWDLTSWRPDVGGRIIALELDAPRNRVVIGGSFTSVAGQTAQHLIAAVSTSTGAPLAWADHPPVSGSNRIIDLDVTDTGVYAAQGGTNFARAYELSSGVERWYFNSDGDNQAIAAYGNKVVVGYHGNVTAPSPNISYQSVGAAQRPERDKIFMLDANSGALQSWSPSLQGLQASSGAWSSPLGVWALDATDGALYVGGDFGRVNGSEQQRFAIFLPQ